MSCGPCKETVECEEIPEDGDEYDALTDLYQRLFEPDADVCCPKDGDNSQDAGRCDCPLTLPGPKLPAPAAGEAAKYCQDGPEETYVKRADRQLSSLLTRHQKGQAEGDVKHLTSKLPGFKSCKIRKPGTVNTTLVGLDLEHWMATATAGDGRDEHVKRAAYDLAAAEAYCKHDGAVEAAEQAVYYEPAGHLAEVAARFGAQSYAGDGGGNGGSGQDKGDDSPVVVIAYVGSTASTED
ncbi:Hypothetical protein CINCED_3A019047 [Cinara cedri]|uniref:Uncharacterized protein n=1 Tax=Cinara cedri TaxID=506608 RepID=A0A5E4M611_9HEMI|nr:Hypothetical protein CINCED_3A019047 [Cinara cedri]